jgi:hypothetical protein
MDMYWRWWKKDKLKEQREEQESEVKKKSIVNMIMDSILILMDTVEPQFKIEIKSWIPSMSDKE